MQKTITILVLSLLLSSGLYAQDLTCVPGFITQDTAIILPEPFNSVELTGGLDSTCVGLFYEEVFTILVPETFPFNGIEVAIDSISIEMEGAIDGLPPGLDYACNPPNCVFQPDTAACFVIAGMLGPDVDPMTYELAIRLQIFNPLIGAIEINFPDDLGNDDESYFIDVASEADCGVTVSTSELQRELSASISPNPTRDYVELSIEAVSAKEVQVLITDVLGKVYKEKSVRLEAGQNTIPYYLDGLGQGIYFMNITDGKDFLSHKIVVEK